jgi:hypothetical protein
VNLNATDRITIAYNFILVIFTFIFRADIAAYTYHLVFNLSVIFLVFLLSFRRTRSSVGTVSLWYPLGLYALFYYQTGLINRVVVPQFMDGFFVNLDVWIFGEFPAVFFCGKHGNAFLDEFFHFCYFSYYLILPLTGILLFRKGLNLFESVVFQLSSLFYLCFVIYLFLPVEGPIALRNEYYHQEGLFRTIVDLIYTKGEILAQPFQVPTLQLRLLLRGGGARILKGVKVFSGSPRGGRPPRSFYSCLPTGPAK